MIKYINYVAWLAKRLTVIAVKLDIKKSTRNSYYTHTLVSGVEEVLKHYSWKASWIDASGAKINSQDWLSSKNSINHLSLLVQDVCESTKSSDNDVLQACEKILQWGGQRNKNQGAALFLQKLVNESRLKQYLLNSRSELSLTRKYIEPFKQVEQMNSMLSKIHSFLAADGLPIYDSRVAATAACFVEIYRREIGKNILIPTELKFPTIAGYDKRRTTNRLFKDCCSQNILRYGQRDTVEKWTKAKWNLGKLFFDVLEREPSLFIKRAI
jgi:hypothetical protein